VAYSAQQEPAELWYGGLLIGSWSHVVEELLVKVSTFLSLFVVPSAICLSAHAQTDSERRLEAHVQFLAADLLRGRGTPSRDLDVSALYLANQLRAYGWQPANNDSYYQTYTLKSFSPRRARYRMSINGSNIDPKDVLFFPAGMDPAGTPTKYDLVFAGHGVSVPERGVDDFRNVDLHGKAVVAFLGAPWELDPQAIHAYDRGVGKSVHVTVRGGSLLVYVSEEFERPADASVSTEARLAKGESKATLAFLPEFQGRPTGGWGPILGITPAIFDKTLADVAGGTYAEWQSQLSQPGFQARDLKASLEVHIDAEPESGRASNVVGMIRGTDPSLREEWIVLTAHYDHLGFQEVPAGKDGIWNGADDNASGTAVVLEIARRLAVGGPLRRSVLVLFTSGEEQGLAGSAYYSRHPLVPYRQVVLNINVDMVGRSTGAVHCVTPGCDEVFEKAVDIGRTTGVTVLPDQHPSWRFVYFIDSYHFARFDVPVIQFMTEFHSDYHQPSDEVNLIRFQELGRIVEVMCGLTNAYAQGEPKPTFRRPEWFLTPD
jgi:hypothetical protein